MVTISQSAPPTPWSQDLSEPRIDPSAYVHVFSNVIGDVRIGTNVMVAPGTSIRADEGYPFYIGNYTNIQDGVVIHGLEKGRVVGDDGQEYSVWIGNHTSITHMALIHGPCYVGDNCFIGFRSTVFNARVGAGCVVMMHALVQDVEVPPGKYIPSGAIITSQQQADRLPDVIESDLQFAHHIIEINDALRAGYHCAENVACITPIRQEMNLSGPGESTPMTSTSHLHDQIRRLLAQGYRIGIEFADERRYRTSSWQTGATLTGAEAEVLRAIQATLADHQGHYVRLIGIDPKARRRVWEHLVQNPTGPITTGFTATVLGTGSSSSVSPKGSVMTGGDWTATVQDLLQQGYKVGLEFADERRYRTSSWTSGPVLTQSDYSTVVANLQAALREQGGMYVRLLGIDSKAKKRVVEKLIQTPQGSVASPNGGAPSASRSYGGGTSVSSPLQEQIRQLLAQGYRVGLEYADERRYRTSSWTSGGVIQSNQESEIISQLQAALASQPGKYVRLLGIDTKAKRRVLEQLIQQPSGAPVAGSGATISSAPSSFSAATTTTTTANRLSSEVQAQVQRLLNEGYRIGTEHADERRYRTSSWQSCAPISDTQPAAVVHALSACLDEHSGEYVRLLGIDTKAKRRVLELLIQTPKG